MHLIKTRWDKHINVDFDRQQGILKIQYWCKQKQKNYVELSIIDIKHIDTTPDTTSNLAYAYTHGNLRNYTSKKFNIESITIVDENETSRTVIDVGLDLSSLDIELLLLNVSKNMATKKIVILHETLLKKSIRDVELIKVDPFNNEDADQEIYLLVAYKKSNRVRIGVDIQTGLIIVSENDDSNVDGEEKASLKKYFKIFEDRLNQDLYSVFDAVVFLRCSVSYYYFFLNVCFIF